MNHLKKLLALTLIVLTAFSCGSDDESDAGNNGSDNVSVDNLSKILGTWFFVLRTTNEVPNELEACEQFNSFIFTANQVSIQEVFGEDCSTTQSTSEEYSINGNTLNVGGFVVEIVHIDNQSLVVTYSEDDDTIVEVYVKQ